MTPRFDLQPPPTLSDLADRWLARARDLDRFAPGVATAFRECAQDIEAALRDFDEAELTLEQAAQASGYSVDHLSRQVREGRIPNAGTKHRPRIRRADLPRKPGAAALRALA